MRTLIVSAATVLLTACGASPAELSLTPPPSAVHTLDPLPLPEVTVIDTEDAVMSPTPAIAWTVTPAELAHVQDGQLVLTGAGTVEVTAAVGAVTQHFSVTVSLPDTLTVTAEDADAALVPGSTVQLAATVSAQGETLDDQPLSWRSETPDVATVSPQGVVTAVAPGTARIVVTSGGIEGEYAVAITEPAPPAVADADEVDEAL